MAIQVNEKKCRNPKFIGRCVDVNTDDYELCVIMSKATEDVETIGYNNNLGKKAVGETFEVNA